MELSDPPSRNQTKLRAIQDHYDQNDVSIEIIEHPIHAMRSEESKKDDGLSNRLRSNNETDVTTDKNEGGGADDGPLSIWWKFTYLISFFMGMVALVLYHGCPTLWGNDDGMAFLILILTIPGVVFASADGFGWANDMVEEQYGHKRAIQVNVATGNGTELISAITAYAQHDPFLANNIVFSAMIINGLFVPSFSTLTAIFIGGNDTVKNEGDVAPHEDFLRLQATQTLAVMIIYFFLGSCKFNSITTINYLFYAWGLYSYCRKTYINILATQDERYEGKKTPMKIAVIYSVCTTWIIVLSLIGTGCVPKAARYLNVNPALFSIVFALEGAIPELYKSINECLESGTYDTPRAVSVESNAQLCGFVLPVSNIIGSNFILGRGQANIVLDPSTAAFYAISTIICCLNSVLPQIEVEVASFQLLLGMFYFISLV